jgi:hypothetical protein
MTVEQKVEAAVAAEVKWFEANKQHALILAGVFLGLGLLVGFAIGHFG